MLRSSRLFLVFRLLRAGALALQLGGNSPVFATEQVLQSALAAHSLTNAEAQRALPVHLRGVVTYADATDGKQPFLFLHDGSGTIYVVARPGMPVPAFGERAEIEGVSGPGQFAPIVVASSIRRLGVGQLPRATLTSLAQMLTGSEDGKWVQISGQVISSRPDRHGRQVLSIQTETGLFHAIVVRWNPDLTGTMADHYVRVRGNAAPDYNENAQLTGVHLFVPDERFVEITGAAPPPSSLPVSTVSELSRFSPERAGIRRMRIRGVVTFSSSDELIIQDGNAAAEVDLLKPAKVDLGTELDAVGFPAIWQSGPILSQSLAISTGRRRKAEPELVTSDKILSGNYDLRLVQVEGRLAEIATVGKTPGLLLTAPNGALIDVSLRANAAIPAHLQPGSYLRVTGICKVRVNHNRVVTGFRVLVRSDQDLQVLRTASWFTAERTWRLLAFTVLFILIAVTWVVVLRKKVAGQTEVIRTQLAQAAALQVKAEGASRAKSEFLANMSHEIRTPMNGVLGMIDLTLQTNPNPEQLEYLEMARTSAQSLLTIIGDILDFSKIEAGKLELVHSEFQLHSLLEQTARMFRPTARQKNLQLECQTSPDLPNFVLGDGPKLQQVLVNLIGNAVKFTERGSVTLAARVESTSGSESVVCFSVHDTGIGIAREKHSAIFDAFAQADPSTTRKYGGTGLGLAISSRIVRLMGGQICLESQPGGGSLFYFCVPLQAVASAAAAQPTVEEAADVQEPKEAAGSLHVLVAEDNRVNQRLACKHLEKLGHTAVIASTGLEALQQIEQQSFDLVLMDVQMPEMDGLEATRQLRSRELGTGRHLPVIALTAHAMEGDRAACLTAGMDDYVSKPIVYQQLLQAIRGVVAVPGVRA